MEKKNFKTKQIVVSACALLLLVGCSSTPRGLKHVPTQPAVVVDPPQTEAEQSFAASASKLDVGGSATIFQTTPIGLAQVFAVATYKNALGEDCKRVELRSKEASLSCGVCLGKNGVWRFIPKNF